MVKCLSKGCDNEGTVTLEGQPVCPSCAELAEALAAQLTTTVFPGRIRYGLGGLKGVGQSLAQGITEERKARGPFRSLEDFAKRVDASLLNKRDLTSLAKAGAFDCLEPNRALVVENIDRIIAFAKSKKRNDESGNIGLNFGG